MAYETQTFNWGANPGILGTMKMHPVYGHEPLLERLDAAIAAGRFPQVTIFEGDYGVGKQRIALRVAQRLLCTGAGSQPCGTCAACSQVLEITHPDLHWFIPIQRPKASDSEKQVAEARDLLSKVLAERREGVLYGPTDGMLGHPLASIRLLRKVVTVRPYSGQVKVVIVGDADRLVIQEASQEAANALLKVLEEPPADTVVILTTCRPGAIISTIRSRTTPVRIPPVADDAVRRFLTDRLGFEEKSEALERMVVLSDGSIGKAVGRTEEREEKDAGGSAFLNSVVAGPDRWTQAAFGQPTFQARGAFSDMLDDMAARLRQKLAGGSLDNKGMQNLLRALSEVTQMREAALTNVNPQLASAALAQKLEGLI